MIKEAAPSRSQGIETKIREYLSQHPGATLQEIGDYLGVSRQWIHVLLKRMNLKTQRLLRKRKLTDYQLEILRYVARGYTDKQIAEVIGCNSQSIRNRLQVIYNKLDVHDRKQAARLAIEQGIISPSNYKPPDL